MRFSGRILQPPRLRFNASLTYATSSKPLDIRRFGPYDSTQFPKDTISCTVVYPKHYEDVKEILIDGLSEGYGFFNGFKQWFRVSINFDEKELTQKDSNQIIRTARSVASEDPDFVFIISSRNPENYRIWKSVLLGNGIPNQVFTSIYRIKDLQQRPWILANLALSTYAKVGGTPWVIAGDSEKEELVIGVSRAQDVTKKYIVGFVTLFTQDGDFLLLYSQAPVIEWERYVEGLKTLIIEAFEEYVEEKGIPDSIILHFHKRPGKRELNAIEGALREIEENIPYALIHLNEYSNYRLFDASDTTYVPLTGLKVELSKRQALLLLDGRLNGPRRKIGVPRVLEVVLDKRSTIDVNDFDGLVQQVYNFSYVNWRGFNARSTPVTLSYSYLISKLVAEIGVDKWSDIMSSGRLRDKAWFI